MGRTLPNTKYGGGALRGCRFAVKNHQISPICYGPQSHKKMSRYYRAPIGNNSMAFSLLRIR